MLWRVYADTPPGFSSLTYVVAVGVATRATGDQLKVNDMCHDKGICYISCDARGVFAYAFCDFGESFVVSDVDGNQVMSERLRFVSRGLLHEAMPSCGAVAPCAQVAKLPVVEKCHY